MAMVACFSGDFRLLECGGGPRTRAMSSLRGPDIWCVSCPFSSVCADAGHPGQIPHEAPKELGKHSAFLSLMHADENDFCQAFELGKFLERKNASLKRGVRANL